MLLLLYLTKTDALNFKYEKHYYIVSIYNTTSLILTNRERYSKKGKVESLPFSFATSFCILSGLYEMRASLQPSGALYSKPVYMHWGRERNSIYYMDFYCLVVRVSAIMIAATDKLIRLRHQ